MARPIKKGLDYFPVDTNILSDLKVPRIKRKYGAESFLLYMTLLCDIYANSFYICADDNYLFDLSEKMQMSESQTLEMVLAMVKIGLFDSQLFQKKRILTSPSIQKRFFSAKRSRTDLFDNEVLCLILIKIDSAKTPVIVAETPQNEGLSTQSKEEKRKEKMSVRERTHAQWEEWKAELLADKDWRASATRQSEQGTGFNDLLPAKLDEFCDFIVSCGEEESVKTLRDFIRRFHFWLSSYGTKKELRAANKRKPQLSRIEELNRVGDASIEIAKRILAGQCC